MSVSTPWTNSTPASTARNNKVTVISDTGTNLDALDITKHRIVFCTVSGGPFEKDHTYTANADEDAWIDITEIVAHTHYDDTDGGGIDQIFNTNAETFDLQLINPTDWVKAHWVQTVTGTGTIEDTTAGTGERSIRLRPNGTSGSAATIALPINLTGGFSWIYKFVTNITIETASSLALHIGMNADDITAADSNTRKFQAEVCTATNNNWWLRTANGTANSASDSGQAISTSKIGITLLNRGYLGTPDCIFGIGGTKYLQKTTNIAVDSSNTTGNSIKYSIKNSTAADRPLKVQGAARLTYSTEATWGYVSD